MKGHPGTGKSTLARAISSAFRLPLLDKDDVRDSTLHLQSSLGLAEDHHLRQLLNDLSYSVLWHVTRTQLGLGLSLVVDSPLSCRAHLDCLTRMASPCGARVVVVECRPGDEGEWRRRLEERGKKEEDGGAGMRHKPGTWEELERVVEGYGGCSEYDVGDVERIVVDTTAHNYGDVPQSVLDFVNSNLSSSYLVSN